MADRSDNLTPSRKLDLTIITPRGVKFEEKADMIVMRAIDGDLGVMPGHEPLSTVLGDGVLRIVNNGSEKHLAVFGGTADIDDTRVRILTTIAQRPDEIDMDRAEEDRLAAIEAMQDLKEEQMTMRLQIMQTRALVRIRVGGAEYFADDENEDVDNKP